MLVNRLPAQLQRVTVTTQETALLPLLYQTRSILRPRNTHSHYDIYQTRWLSYMDPKDGRPDSCRRQTSNSARQKSSENSVQDENVGRTSTSESSGVNTRRSESDFSHSSETYLEQGRPARAPHVPFEGDTGWKASTMTPREFKIFEALYNKKSGPAEPSNNEKASRTNSRQDDADFSKLDTVLERLRKRIISEREVPVPTRPMGMDIKERRPKDKYNLMLDAESPSAQSERLEHIKALLDSADTDVELWQILQHHVFHPIKALELDALNVANEKEPSNGDSVASPSSTTENSETASPSRDTNLQIMSANLPSLLTYSMRLSQEAFPASSLALTLLPTLKKLGPAAFALGASTKLYNQHMDMLYRKYFDLDGVADVLNEMDREVYQFDRDTQVLLTSILKDARLSVQGQKGVGRQALSHFDRRRRATEKLRAWLEVVQERVKGDMIRKPVETRNGIDI